MPIEREWRFVVLRGPRVSRGDGRRIEQGYLHYDEKLSIRIRITSNRVAALGLKTGRGEGHRSGPRSREEFEYDVPLADARRLMRATDGKLVKCRHRLGRIELDVYEGALRGLVIAEIEVNRRTPKPPDPPPGWRWREVSHDERYGNARLALIGLPRGAPRARLDLGSRRV